MPFTRRHRHFHSFGIIFSLHELMLHERFLRSLTEFVQLPSSPASLVATPNGLHFYHLDFSFCSSFVITFDDSFYYLRTCVPFQHGQMRILLHVPPPRVHVHHVSHSFDVNKRSGIMQTARAFGHGESMLLAVTTCVVCVLYEIIAKWKGRSFLLFAKKKGNNSSSTYFY